MSKNVDSFDAAQLEVLERVAAGAPLPEVLESIVTLIERHCDGMLCSILLLDPDGRTLRHGAAPGLPKAFVDAIDGTSIGPDVGSCGAAAHRQERVIVEDVAIHPNWVRYRKIAAAANIRACWSTPIWSPQHQVLGTFAMYYRQPRGPTAREIEWVAAATHLTAIAVVHARSERSLRDSEERAQQLARLYAVSSSVGEALVRFRDPQQLYEVACRIAVEQGLAALAWIGTYDAVQDRVVPRARFGNDDGYVDAIRLRLRDPSIARGPAALAIDGDAVAVSNDIANDPDFHWKVEALQRGLRSCAVFPLRIGGWSPGVFAIYGDTPGFFRAEEIRVLSTLADNIAFAVESAATEAERLRLFGELGERVKELTVLHRFARVLQSARRIDAALLQQLVELVPSGWRHPERCVACIQWSGLTACSTGWVEHGPAIGAAIVVAEQAGRIDVAYRASGDAIEPPFIAEERELIASLAEMLSAQFGRVEAERGLREREQRLRLLQAVGEAIRTDADPDQVLPTALRLLGEHFQVSRCVYVNVHPDGDRCIIPFDYADGCASIVGAHRLSDFGGTVAARLRAGTGPVVFADVDAELPTADAAAFAGIGVKAFVACTLVRDGALRAMMAVTQSTHRVWQPADVELLQEVVERCWSSVEQRAAEQKLRQSEALLRIAGRTAKLGGWTVELHEDHITWSDEVCAIYEVPPGTTPSLEQVMAYSAPEFRGRATEAFAACARDGTPLDIELQIITALQRRVWVRAIGRAERNAAGAIVRLQGALQDIDDRRKLEEQLHQSQKMEAIGQLAGGVAHDFNNLLSVILSHASLVIASRPLGDPLRADVEQIAEAGERAAELTRQLLTFSRQQRVRARVVDPSRIVLGLEKMLRRLIGEDITLTLSSAAACGNVLADRGQIEQVVMNLVVNARDAMPAGGSLTIETGTVELDTRYAAVPPEVEAGHYHVLSVTDTGHGMDAATRARVFEPFFTTKPKGKGTGLGLSTVYGIVRQAGGHVAIDSEPGRGTKVSVYLPRVDAPIEHDETGELPPSELSRGDETVLVVEDVDQVRAVIAQVLRRAGYRVIEAQNAGEALLVCEQFGGDIQLMLTDVVMPRMSGPELAERIAPLRPGTRVLYMSGYTDNAMMPRGVIENGLAYIAKPITPAPLLHAVRRMLDAPAS